MFSSGFGTNISKSSWTVNANTELGLMEQVLAAH